VTVNPPGGAPAVPEKAAVAAPAAPAPSKGATRRDGSRPSARRKPETEKAEPTAPAGREMAQTPVRLAEMLPDGHDEVLDKTEAIVSKLLISWGWKRRSLPTMANLAMSVAP